MYHICIFILRRISLSSKIRKFEFHLKKLYLFNFSCNFQITIVQIQVTKERRNYSVVNIRIVQLKLNVTLGTRSLISDFNLLDCYNRKTTVRAGMVSPAGGRSRRNRASRSIGGFEDAAVHLV